MLNVQLVLLPSFQFSVIVYSVKCKINNCACSKILFSLYFCMFNLCFTSKPLISNHMYIKAPYNITLIVRQAQESAEKLHDLLRAQLIHLIEETCFIV